MYWGLLVGAIIFELIGTLSLKYSSVHSNAWAIWLMAFCYAISFALLWGAVKKLDISIAYAIWSGVGTALISFAGVVLFKEEIGFFKIACIGLIILGVVGLNFLSQH